MIVTVTIRTDKDARRMQVGDFFWLQDVAAEAAVIEVREEDDVIVYVVQYEA